MRNSHNNHNNHNGTRRYLGHQLERKPLPWENELIAFALGLFAGLVLFSNTPW